jgi:phage terminase large subunit-like protein
MNKFLKVAGHAGLVRDTSTGAILNTNKSEYEEYLENQRKLDEKEKQIFNNTKDISEIKTELQDIKMLLLQLLTKGN